MSESGARRVLRDVAANSRGSPPASAFTGFAGLGSGMTKVPMVLLLCLVLAAPILPMAGGVVHAPLPTLASAASHPLAGGAPNALSSSAGAHGLAVPVFHSPGTIYARTLPAGGESPSAGAPTVVEARTGASARLVGVLRPFASLGELPTSTPSGASAAATASPGPALGATGSSMKNGTLGWNGSDYIAGKLYPPDGGLAIGRGYIVEEINANIRIWTTSGTYVTQASLDTFYQSTTGAFLGDTALLYDDQHDHFIALTINITTNLLIFSVSQTSDPTGAWWEYVLPVIGANLPDQPFIGIDSNTFAVTANDAGGAYAYEAWFLNLSDIDRGRGVVVGHPGPWRQPGEVLLERERGRVELPEVAAGGAAPSAAVVRGGPEGPVPPGGPDDAPVVGIDRDPAGLAALRDGRRAGGEIVLRDSDRRRR